MLLMALASYVSKSLFMHHAYPLTFQEYEGRHNYAIVNGDINKLIIS